ncbi:MAG TPA: carbonate dehydratase [Gemmatimonadales bacterium]|nr:carbonate dehydratase [Gemmatimonadales bacterium]
MASLPDLLSNNRKWADGVRLRDPGFFDRLSRIQSPRYLWIGCSDSRVPANEIVGLMPGELFVHRNVANIVVHSDLNCLSVLQYAVEVLRVDHVIVCGHYGCGGVEAAWRRTHMGLIDNWLRHVQDIAERHDRLFTRAMTDAQSADRLCELNVLEQVANVCRTTVLHDAWGRGQQIAVHGWIYRLQDGIIHDLGLTVTRESGLLETYDQALAALVAAKGSGSRLTV